jgi:hypothetical protein
MKKHSLNFTNISFILFFGILSVSCFSQNDSAWKSLSKLTYKKAYDALLGYKVDVPIFSNEVKALEGKSITLRGYVIPTDGFKSHKEFVFSAFPYNMCFFCGAAGPETVIEVLASEPIKYTSEAIYIKGILVLNDKDPNKLMYGIKNAVKVNN